MYLSRKRTLFWTAAPMILASGLVTAGGGIASAMAQEAIPAISAPASSTSLPPLVDGKRIFLPAYFNDISPQSAADMVSRIPGFGIEDGEDVRGFGGAAGNVLIDGARPTSKNEGLRAILGRIPANYVSQIELLEGAAAGALAPGKSLVVNVVRKADTKSAGQWEVQATGVASGRIKPKFDTSYTFKVKNFNVTTGLHAEIENVSDFVGFEGFIAPDGRYTEVGPNDDRRRSKYARATLAVDGSIGDTKLNTNASYLEGDNRRLWVHTPFRPGAATPFRIDEGGETGNTKRWEVGGDLERVIHGWTGKLALLAKGRNDEDSELAGFNLIAAPRSFERFGSQSETAERVGRLTFKRKLGKHQIETGGELAYNSLDFAGEFSKGDGINFIVRPSDISTTQVSENRTEAFISDSWTLTDTLTLESTLTGEWSTIEQTGDAGKTRSFFYPKPRVKAAWKPDTNWTYRFEVERAVGQLDFYAFADSATVGDSNQNSGNPELRPEQTWSALIGVERRWGKRGVFNASWVQEELEDHLSLVPTASGGVALGNIPAAQRWGYNISMTLPLPQLLEGLEVATFYRWRDSELNDPLTGGARPFSGWNGRNFEANIRYERPQDKLRMGAWIWRGDSNSDFRPNQIFRWSTIESWGLWVETRAVKGLTIELGVEDPNGSNFNRVRTDFNPDRRSGVIRQTQYRERSRDGLWYLNFKGSF